MEKMFWSMGEVAEMLDVTPSLIRFWETKFDVLAPRKNEKGTRRFSRQDVDNLKTVYHLVKERGMTLSGAAKHLKTNRITTNKDAAIAEKLQSIRAILMEVREEIGEPVQNIVATPKTFVEQTLF